MASVWKIVAYYCLPVPLILFSLLSIPLPKSIRRGVLIFVHRVFDLPLIGVLRLLHVMLFITSAALLEHLCGIALCAALLAGAGSMRQVQHMRELQENAVFTTPNMEIGHLSKRWRAERNLWMSAFAFASWLMLAAFYREAVCRLELQDRWDELEKAEPPSETTTQPTDHLRSEPPSAAREREVNSRGTARPASPNKTEPAPPGDVLRNPPRAGEIELEGKKEL